MKTPSEPVPDAKKREIFDLIEEQGPMSHGEIVENTSAEDTEVQRVLNKLWREGKISHTVDRQFAVRGK